MGTLHQAMALEVEQEGEQRRHVDNWYLEEEDKTGRDRIRIIDVEVERLGGRGGGEEGGLVCS